MKINPLLARKRASPPASIQASLRACLVIALSCLLAGYGLAGQWLILPALAGMALGWLALRDRPGISPHGILLVAYIFLAAGGILFGGSPYLMIAGVTAALACWDLRRFAESLEGDQVSDLAAALQKQHLEALALAASLGLLLGLGGALLRLHIPFGLTVFLVLMAYLALERGLRRLDITG